MSLYTKALRHINMDRVKELREENIKKQKLAEEKLQEEIIHAELKKIHAEQIKHVNWRRELEEGMTTDSLSMINLPADPDTIQTSIPSTTISSADNIGSPTEDGVVPRVQSFQVVDATKTDTITLTISGSFTTKTIGDSDPINDKVSVGVLVGGTYGGNYLAGGGRVDGLGNGTHTLTIPQKFRKAGVTFDAIQITAFQGESGTVSITGAGLKRVNRMNVFVSLDDPEASAFIRDTLSNQNLSPAQKKKKLEEMLGASAEYVIKMFGEGAFTGATEIADYEPQQSFMDIMVGDQQITQQDGKTITDTTRDIEDGMMDGEPFNPEPPQKEPPKSPTRRRGYGLTRADIRALAARDGVPYYSQGDPDEIVYDMSDRLGRSNSQTQQDQQKISDPLEPTDEPTDDKAELEKSIEDSLKQLETDNENLKGESARRNALAIVSLGLDVATAIAILNFFDGPVGELGLQGAKQAVQQFFKKGATKTAAQQVYGQGIKSAVAQQADDAVTDLAMRKNSLGKAADDVLKKLDDAMHSGNTQQVQNVLKQADDLISGRGTTFTPKVRPSSAKTGGGVGMDNVGTTPSGAFPRNSPMKGIKNSYEPEGKVIVEKKKLKSPKSLLDKIPGYYDGKPAPLGFPIEEPPKMKNGMHPDLVDGKKVANRYNRLDPTSAKAMPKTGNPHIDKKVKAAAKKPK